uniref:Uncharacterized protein n=1 Tax=Anopheles culicifacies TaxID=139723 RepID=A0A182LY20_9DIPT
MLCECVQPSRLAGCDDSRKSEWTVYASKIRRTMPSKSMLIKFIFGSACPTAASWVRSVEQCAGTGGCVSKGRMGLSWPGAGNDTTGHCDTASSACGLLHLSLCLHHRQIIVRFEGRIYSSIALILTDHGGRTVHTCHTTSHHRELEAN